MEIKNASNRYIEDLIKQRLRNDEKLVSEIMETLSIGKESAYRRLRGEVPYTLDDALKIAAKYNISLDSIVGERTMGRAIITTNIMDVEKPIASYKEYLTSQYDIFRRLNSLKSSRVTLAFNLIPFTFYSSHNILSKFRIYRWIHQLNTSGNHPHFKDVKFPDELWNLQKNAVDEFSKLADVSFIFDNDLFLKQIKDILLFVQLGLIDQESLKLLQVELYELLDSIEQMTNMPADNNFKRSIYVSNVSFEASYIYYEAEDLEISGLRVLGIGLISTQDPWISSQLRKWIESLKRYSTLISISGEIDRLTFINRQKEHIKILDI